MTPTRPRLKPPRIERFSIPITVPGPTYGDDSGYFTQNPILIGEHFEVRYGDYTVRLCMDHHYFSNGKVSVVELVSVVKTKGAG